MRLIKLLAAKVGFKLLRLSKCSRMEARLESEQAAPVLVVYVLDDGPWVPPLLEGLALAYRKQHELSPSGASLIERTQITPDAPRRQSSVH